MLKKTILILFFIGIAIKAHSQEINNATRMLLLQSAQTSPKGKLLLSASYRGGTINAGSQKLWWDLAYNSLRLSLHYGISDRIEFGLSRNAWEEHIESSLKLAWYKKKRFQITSYHAVFYTFTDKWQLDERVDFQSSRFAFVHQLIFGFQVNNDLYIQLSNSLIHKNLVANAGDAHDSYIPAIAIKQQVGKKTDLRAEFARKLKDDSNIESLYMSLGIGMQYKKHELVFYLSNAHGFNEAQFLSANTESWNKGQVNLGFLFQRHF